MHFSLLDQVLERTADRIVTCKLVTASEEYLQDHFPSFPVLPGVFMLEAMVQAGRELVSDRAGVGLPLVLGSVRALKYGSFVRPGESLRVEVTLTGGDPAAGYSFQGQALRVGLEGDGSVPAVAVSGRFVLRPARVGRPVVAGGGGEGASEGAVG